MTSPKPVATAPVVTVDDLDLEDILNRHQISPHYRPAFRLLIAGKIEDPQFRLRLEVCLNYKAACDEILELLSRPYSHLFSSTPKSIVLETL